MNKTIRLFLLFAAGLSWSLGQGGVQVPLEKDKNLQNAYALISESDLSCSFFILDAMPRLRIMASERGGEKTLLADGDLFYFKAGAESGLKEGQIMAILELGSKVPGLRKNSGSLAFRRGRARILRLENGVFSARVEKACAPVLIGDYLVPFEEKEGLLGKDLGFDVPVRGGDVLAGRIVYLDGDLYQIGPGQRALIDLGKDNGLEVGRQLTVFHRAAKDAPLEAVGNVIVIDTGRQSATVKVLSAKDALRLDDIVQVK